MKRTLSILAAALLMVSMAGLASATDGIGVFMDEAGTLNCAAPAAYTNVPMYLVAQGLSSSSGLSGWECSVITDPATLTPGIGFTISNGGLNVLAPPNFQVGLPAVVAYAPNITLATMNLFYLGGPIKIGIGPCTPSSFGPGTVWPDLPVGPGFAQGDNPGILKNLFPVSNIPAGTANTFWVNYLNVVGETCPGNPVGTEVDSWGGVKSLFK